MSQTNDERREIIKADDEEGPSKESLERMSSSIKKLQAEKVPTIPHLGTIDDSKNAKARTTEEIAQRAVAISICAAKSQGLDDYSLGVVIKRFGAKEFFSPLELAFVEDEEPRDQQMRDFSWKNEDAWVLMWALGYVDTLDRPENPCDVEKIVRSLGDGTKQFIAKAKLRPMNEILDQADLYYRYFWAVKDAQIRHVEIPAGLHEGVVTERDYAFRWLIGFKDQKWDDITPTS